MMECPRCRSGNIKIHPISVKFNWIVDMNGRRNQNGNNEMQMRKR